MSLGLQRRVAAEPVRSGLTAASQSTVTDPREQSARAQRPVEEPANSSVGFRGSLDALTDAVQWTALPSSC